MTSKKEAQKIARKVKAKAAKAEASGDRVLARAHQEHAALILDKLQRGDYED